jgi:hypothetical protein
MKETVTTITRQQKINQPGFFIKRIGNTIYRVGVYFNSANTETAQDKITRLIRTEAEAGKADDQ